MLENKFCYINGLGPTRKEQLQKFQHQEQEQRVEEGQNAAATDSLVQLQVTRKGGVRSSIHNT